MHISTEMQLRQIPLEFLLGPLSRAPLASAAHYQRSEIVFSSAKLSQRHGSQSMSLTLFGPLLFSFALLSGRQRPFPLLRHYLSLSLSLSLPLSDVEHIVFAAKKNIFLGYYGAISWPPPPSPPEERMVLCSGGGGGSMGEGEEEEEEEEDDGF